MNAPRIFVPTVTVAVCLIAASVIPAGVASAQEKEIVLRPGEVWRVYDAQGAEVGRLTVDDVVEGVDVVQYHTTDLASGQDSEKASATLAQVRAAIAAEIAKGEKANRGYFMDRDHINFAAAGTLLAADLAPAEAEGEAPAPAPAPSPAPSPAEGPPAPGVPAAPAGPPGADEGPGAPPGPPAAPAEEGEGEDKGLPLLPILVVIAVVLAVVIVVVVKKKGRGSAGVVAEEPPPPAEAPPPPDSEDTG